MLFSVNQASHLYVVKDASKDVAGNAGDIVLKTTDDGKNMYFSYMGEGGLLRSDLIPVENIIAYSYKSALSLKTPLKKATVSLNSEISATPIAGEDYILRIKYSIGSIDNQYIKYGAVRGFTGMTAENFYKKMHESLTSNFKRETEPAFEFTYDANGVYITELEPKWVLGTYPQRPIDFEISVDTIVADGVEGPWGKVTIANSGNAYPNSKKIADLEWFCMGERGDQYKNYGWPNVIPTKYMVDATNTDGYSVMNIHYSYVGSNESVQKSEKDIFLVGLESALSVLKTEVEKLVK